MRHEVLRLLSLPRRQSFTAATQPRRSPAPDENLFGCRSQSRSTATVGPRAYGRPVSGPCFSRSPRNTPFGSISIQYNCAPLA
jgi:hypothetical protein